MMIDRGLSVFKKKLSSVYPLTAEAWGDFCKLLRSVPVQRGDYLFREGAFIADAAFLVKGLVRSFCITPEGKEYVKAFFPAGSFPFPISSILLREPNRYAFQAMEDCELVVFNYQAFALLFDRHRCLETITRKIMEHSYIEKEKREIAALLEDATIRYKAFRAAYPGMESKVPQYMIASYLGITPVQLSRIRRKIWQASRSTFLNKV